MAEVRQQAFGRLQFSGKRRESGVIEKIGPITIAWILLGGDFGTSLAIIIYCPSAKGKNGLTP